MILNKIAEKRKVEKARNLLNGLVAIYLIVTAIVFIGGFKTGMCLDLAIFCILIASNIYFYKVKSLYKKYTRYFACNADWIDSDKNMEDIFIYTKYNEVKKLGNTVLNDTVIVKDGYYSTIGLSVITVVINTYYDLYKFVITEELSPFLFVIIILISLFLIIPILQNIENIDNIKKQIKGFIVDKGWDKKWKK